MKSNRNQFKVFAFAAVLCLVAGTGEASERKDFLCNTKPDPMFGKCSIEVNAVTRTTNGVSQKGHLVYCQQSLAYTCMENTCEENYGRSPKNVSHNLAMTDYTGFCKLLCTHPVCNGVWEEKKK